MIQSKNGPAPAASSLSLVAVFLILCVIWGTTWLFIKVGLRDLPPLTFAGIRFVIAATVLFVANALRGVPLLPRTRAEWILLAGTGVLTFSVNYGLLFWGEQHISSGLASLLQATIPAFGLVIAHGYLPGERLSWPKALGVALGLVGWGSFSGTSSRWRAPWRCGAVPRSCSAR